MTISGSILLYKEELINSSLCVKKESNSFSLELLQKNIKNHQYIKVLSFPSKSYRYYKILFVNGNTKYYLASNSKELKCKIIIFLDFLSKLHYNLFLSKYLLVFFGALLSYLLISGFFIARKYKLYKILTSRKLNYKLAHIKVGVVFFPFLLIYILSGVFLPLKKTFVKNIFKEHILYPNIQIKDKKQSNDFALVFNNIRNIVDNGYISKVYFSNKNKNEYIFRIRYFEELHPNGKSFLLVNSSNQKIIQNIDARKHPKLLTIIENIYTFHVGKYDEIFHRVFILLIVLILWFLSLMVFKKTDRK